MTNPISKAIVKAAVAMGYGKKSDYKGSSIADVLEKFAAIAKDKGSSGDGLKVYTISGDNTIQTGLSAIDFVGATFYNGFIYQSVLIVGTLGEQISMFVAPPDGTSNLAAIQYNPTTGKLTTA